MNLIQNYMTKNRCYTNGTKIQVKKLVLHSLGVAQPDADAVIKQWNTKESSKCPHAFIETDRIIQVLPWDYKGWHVGSGSKGSYNASSIGVEICEPKGHTYNGGTMIGYDVAANAEYFKKVYNNAVWLFAKLCYDYSLNPVKDVLCHSEVYALGYGSNHADVMHWFPKHGKSMDTFRNDVKALLQTIPTKTITAKSDTKSINWAKDKLNQLLGSISGITPLKLNGKFDPELRIATLVYWNKLGWGEEMADDGTRIGKATIKALTADRKK